MEQRMGGLLSCWFLAPLHKAQQGYWKTQGMSRREGGRKRKRKRKKNQSKVIRKKWRKEKECYYRNSI
jgi:hypothetical protein